MSEFQEGRSEKTIEVRKKLKALNNKNNLRVRIAGATVSSINTEIKYLENLRKTLPPIRNESKEALEARGSRMTNVTAGMSGIYNNSGTDDVAFWAGGSFEGAIYTMMNPNNLNPKEGQKQANCVITHWGTLIANQAIIRGDIYANDGVFNGTVYAKDGVFEGTVYATDGEFNGKITSNNEGNKIIVDPSNRSIQLINSNDVVLGKWYFYSGNGWETSRLDLSSIDNNGNVTDETRIVPGYLEMETAKYKLEMEAARINIVGDSKQFRVSVDETKTTLQLSLMNLPTSKKGLNSGDVWRDGEYLKIVP